MILAGYIASALIGISLGLIGGGGSILTVPVLVYLFNIHPTLATSYSLFVVGSTSLVGAYTNHRKGLVNIKTGLLFGISSITTVFLTRKLLLPAIPQTIAVGHITVSRSFLTMVLFAVLMLPASLSMIKNGQTEPKPEDRLANPGNRLAKLLFYGILVGIVTGLLGAGGGFLLIPTLVLLVGLPMKEAIGTSLFIIALNSLIGFTGDIGHFKIDWLFIGTITLIAIAGIITGGMLAKTISGEKLKKSFGWFVLSMGIYIIIKEVWLK
ncbi:MAG TPA: sulfite exporter TauE/SafE family protein [Puia sp.]